MSIKNLTLMLMALAVGLAGGYLFSGTQKQTGPDTVAATGPCPDGAKPLSWRNPMNPAITSPVFSKDEMGMDYLPICAEVKKEKKILFYRNPMNPAITSPVAAKDEMGMDYIPVYDDGARSGPAGTVSIDPTVVQNIGVRTTVALQKTISRDIRTVGRVTFDEQRVARLHPKVEGWVEKLFVDRTGEQVDKDTMLLAIYSPQLVASGEEYLLALKNWQILKDSPFADIREGAKRLLSTSLERLQLLDVPEHQLKEIRNTGHVPKALHIHSPFDGIVMNIGAREGQRITPETELYMVADLSRVWVQVDIYEDELPWVRLGDEAEMELPAAPGRIFKGKLSYIYPYLDANTRTNKVRIEFANPDLVLKPEMFANISLKASRTVDAVVIPSEAIVRSGTRDQIFVQRGPGKFEPREVTLGLQADGEVQILSGLKAGELVVTSSQFLIDSESKLREATAKMLEPGEQQPASPESDMDMKGMEMKPMQPPASQPSHQHIHDHGVTHE
ncbi:MAG: efflux transporter periplasmic adaptor subunit [Zetaproteobacteria bacterium CG1_02_53_45]|nr:MAG: efflux transporter periplasmic adaptor subunit [Zetaproteobacteria bacterium CG1_02_53_45]